MVNIANQRMRHQHIARPSFEQPGQVVQWMGAMQAQDYQQALWAVALRTTNATLQDVEQAIADRSIILTWPMRGTIHLVAAADVRGLLQLCASRKLAADATRQQQLELDGRILERCGTLFQVALAGGQALTRSAMLELLERAGIHTGGQRGYHILWYVSQQGLLCFGPRQGKEQTFVLLEDWIPKVPHMARDDVLAQLVLQYFRSHGPATVQDFVHWTGLTVRDARSGLEAVRSQLQVVNHDQRELWFADQATPPTQSKRANDHLLPGFDEYIIGYKDRSDVLAAEHARFIVPGGNGVFKPMLVVNGQVVGTWKRTVKTKGIEVLLEPFVEVEAIAERFSESVERYCRCVGLPLQQLKCADVSLKKA